MDMAMAMAMGMDTDFRRGCRFALRLCGCAEAAEAVEAAEEPPGAVTT